MFQDLDDTLSNLLDDAGAPALLRGAMKSFLTPDRNLAGKLNGQTTVDLFLHRIQENRELRDTVGFAEPGDPPTMRRQPLLRVDCSYLVTAWAFANNEEEVNTEHQLLGQALQWLSRFPTIPTAYLSGSLDRGDFPLPYSMAAHLDPDRVPIDFWTALGIPPRPSFDLTVTIAIDLAVGVDEGPAVIARELDLEQIEPPAPPAPAAQLFSIGGTVRAAATGAPIAGASVGLANRPRARDRTTDADGHFRLDGLAAGAYLLRAAAPGLPPQTKPVQVPPTAPDAYDFTL